MLMPISSDVYLRRSINQRLLYIVYYSFHCIIPCFLLSSFITIFIFFFQAEDGIRDHCVTGVQTCALPISYSRYFFGTSSTWQCILKTEKPRVPLKYRLYADIGGMLQYLMVHCGPKYALTLRDRKSVV